jgi:hypothetical protein
MNDLYTIKYLYDILFLLSAELEDLSKWSVYNNDTCLDEIHELSEKFEEVKKKLFEIGGTDIDRTLKGGETENDGIEESTEEQK